MDKKVGIIAQARMTSTRLPGKIMLEAAGIPLIKYHINRLKMSDIPIYIATTTNEEDDVIVNFANLENLLVYRGDEHNVLGRFYECALKYKLDIVIRVTSDCPLIDGSLIKSALEQYVLWDDPQVYYSNCLKRTFPRGFDFEIFSFDQLNEAYVNADAEFEKEHVTPYINRNRSGSVLIKHFLAEEDFSYLRITLDTPDDYRLIKTLIEVHDATKFDYKGIISIFDKNPELAKINAHVEQKKV